jgi:hypothetical protein
MNAVGAHALRRYLLEQGWRHYLEVIPEILKNLSTKKNSIMAVRTQCLLGMTVGEVIQVLIYIY